MYNISNVKHRFQIYGYCRQHNMQKHNFCRWKCYFVKMLLTNREQKSLIWIYRWNRWATRWQSGQFGWFGSLPSISTRADASDLMTTRTASFTTVRFGPNPGPEMTVRNCCYHYRKLGVIISAPILTKRDFELLFLNNSIWNSVSGWVVSWWWAVSLIPSLFYPKWRPNMYSGL